jgi:hypothetical protein
MATIINTPCATHTVPFAIILVLLVTLPEPATGSDPLSPTEEALQAIHNCITDSPPLWPQPWQQEYLQLIPSVLMPNQGIPAYEQNLQTLANGFRSYWQGFKKAPDRALFELQCVQIRWYIESLMGTVPDEKDRQTLRSQWRTLWQDAAQTLLIQFPFLDPNIVQRATADHVHVCLEKIEVPLEPVYRKPFTADHIKQIKQGWHDMRYARVDLMRQLGGEAVFLDARPPEESGTAHPDYLLAERCLKQMLGTVWMVTTQPPDNYRNALDKHRDAQMKRRQRISKGRAEEGRLRRDRSQQIFQAEYLGFMLSVLLESPQCLQAPSVDDVSKNTTHINEPMYPKEVMPMR